MDACLAVGLDSFWQQFPVIFVSGDHWHSEQKKADSGFSKRESSFAALVSRTTNMTA